MIDVLFDCVLIKPKDDEDAVSSGGIVLSHGNPESSLTEGEVINVGQGKRTSTGSIITPSVTQGDKVLFNKSKIIDLHTIDDVEYYIIREENIVAII